MDVADMKKVKKIALSGVFTALCTVFLLIGSIFQTLDLSAAAFGSIIIMVAMIEMGKSYAFSVYLASSILSLILLPNKTAALVFALFSGFYPIIKEPLNRIKPLFLSYTARVLLFNATLSLLIYILSKAMLLSTDVFWYTIAFYLLGNLTFIVYDFALERVALTYVIRIKPVLFRKR